MTPSPKEKAKELVDKYYKSIQGHKYHYVNETAKQCALIAVEEIIIGIYSNSLISSDVTRIFWQQVKTEIELL